MFSSRIQHNIIIIIIIIILKSKEGVNPNPFFIIIIIIIYLICRALYIQKSQSATEFKREEKK